MMLPILPPTLAVIFMVFSPMFTQPTGKHLQLLLIGAILCQGKRQVSAILRVMGLSHTPRFEKYHRVFNRADWAPLTGAKILLGLLISLLPETFPLTIVVDETLERRQGKTITAKGHYRDACRSHRHKVVTSLGLKWVCFMIIVPLPWCKRPWALPFLTLLSPSKEYHSKRGRRHKTSIDWTILAIRLLSRWIKRSFVLIGDGGFACIRLGHVCLTKKVTLISRLRTDAALYDFAPIPAKGQRGRHRQKGARFASLKQLAQDKTQPWHLSTLPWYGGMPKTIHWLSGSHLWYSPGDPPLPIRWVVVTLPGKKDVHTFFTTQLSLSPEAIIQGFVLRWNIEVTFAEVRAHLGMETQRQWAPKAIAKTTPCVMALFSFTCLFGLELLKNQPLPILSTAWYQKKGEATFSDILACVKRHIWEERYFNDSGDKGEYVKIKREVMNTLLDQLARTT